jgi:outer membrane protein
MHAGNTARCRFRLPELATLGLVLAVSGAARGEGFALDTIPNAAILAVGAMTDWLGSKDYDPVVGPALQLELPHGATLQVLGPLGSIQMPISDGWSAGLDLDYVFGRSHVKDPVVALLPEIRSSVAAGVTFAYERVSPRTALAVFRTGIDLTWDVTGLYGGTQWDAWARGWIPVATAIPAEIGIGAEVAHASQGYISKFFDVSPQSSAASGIDPFTGHASLRDARAWSAVLIPIGGRWLAGAGIVYQRLLGDAADSTIVQARGSKNQFIAGAGVAYVWR